METRKISKEELGDKVLLSELEPFGEDGSGLMAAETSWRGMADELQELHYLKGGGHQFLPHLYTSLCKMKKEPHEVTLCFKMGSIDKALPHAGFYPDSQN